MEEVDVFEDTPDGVDLEECRACCQAEITAEVGNFVVHRDIAFLLQHAQRSQEGELG